MTKLAQGDVVMRMVAKILAERAAKGGRHCKGVKKNIKDLDAWKAKSKAAAMARWGKKGEVKNG